MKYLLLLTLFIIPTSVSAAFTDVPASHPYATAISWAKSEQLIKGYADGSFKPDTYINRAEFLKILVGYQWSEVVDREDPVHSQRYEDCVTEGNSAHIETYGLTDIDSRAWYVPYTCYALKAGVVSGYSDCLLYTSPSPRDA